MTHPVLSADRQVLFVGVDATNSLAMAVVPHWSKLLGTPLQVRPIDVAAQAGSTVYEQIVDQVEAGPAVAGAVITGHKTGMYAAAKRRCRYIAPDAVQLRECAVLAGGCAGLAAYATDVQSVGAEVDRIWPASGAPVVCLGAGGSGAALCLHLLRRTLTPQAILVCERDDRRAAEFVHLFGATPRQRGVDLQVESGSDIWDDTVMAMPPGALIVNATGLGKTRPESPLSDGFAFPRCSTVWDLNYRGPLPFLASAVDQAESRDLRIHDGRHLFALGWLAALTAVLGIVPPVGIEDAFVAVLEETGR